MTVTWGAVSAWVAGPLNDAVGGVNASGNKLLACSDDVCEMNALGGWSGPAADAAHSRVDKLTYELREHVADVAALRRILADTADAITGVQNAVLETQHLAAVQHFTITADGDVLDAGLPGHYAQTDADWAAVFTERRVALAELRTRVDETVQVATAIDNGLCDVLDRLLYGHIIDPARTAGDDGTMLASAAANGYSAGGLPEILPPPDDGGFDHSIANAAYWAALSDSERRDLIRYHPDIVGQRDGFPAVARDEANRAVLARDRMDLVAQRDAVAGELAGGSATSPQDLRQRLDDINAKLASIDDLQTRLATNRGTPEQMYLLEFDLRGNQGHVVIAEGNPDTSANVATFVPGTGTNVAHISGTIDHATAMFQQAQQSGSSSTSVITWLGYDAPPHIPDAAHHEWADVAAAPLTQFEDGLHQAHDPSLAMHSTVLGHSYGSTVVGDAAATLRGQPLADDLVFVASPGAGPNVHGVLDLGVNPLHVHATTAQRDIIHLTSIAEHLGLADDLGADPSSSAFDGEVFNGSSGHPDWPVSAAAHGAYWDRANPALQRMGQIIAGS